jgi:hypothetical protein
MTDKERIDLGLTKKLTYRYAYASGDIHKPGEEGTYFLRALARMGVYLEKNEKYFTPDSIKEIKKKKENPNYETKLVNPIYISDHQVPMEYFEIEKTGGEALYDYDQEPPVFLGFAPIDETKKVIRQAERKLSPPGAKFGLQGGGGTADDSIPKEGTSSDIKNITAQKLYYTSERQNGAVPAKFEAIIKIAGAENSFIFDRTGYITVLGVKYSALQVLFEFDNSSALKYWREQLKGDSDANAIMDSWGLVETKTSEENKEGLPDREEDTSDPNAGSDGNKTPDDVKKETDTSSLSEKINIMRGWIVKDGKVEYDKNGKPKKSTDKAPQLRISDTATITIETDGSVSIDGDVQINVPDRKDSVRLIENGKFTIPFGKINGNFNCQKVTLTTLANSPKTVTGTFDCSKNNLTTLAGGPQEVGRFIASDNKSLTTLVGGPKIIRGITDSNKSQNEFIYDVSGCSLTSLDGNGITTFGPGGFNCAGNKITSLTGLGVVTSTGVTRFDCSNNELTSLNGIPRPVKDAKTGKPGDYWIRGNVGITVFPASMAEFEIGTFEAGGLSLTSLSFAPKQVYGNFDCSTNKGTKKLTNQSIGKDRFKIGGGFEEDATNRIVKIDGDFITSEGIWKDKTYDINTVFTKSETPGANVNFNASVSGNMISLDGGKIVFTQIPNPSTLSIIYKIAGKYTNSDGATQWEFEAFRPIGEPGTNSYNNTWVAKYAQGRPSPFSKPFRSWDQQFPNLKNYINWSMFERGDSGWGWGQPTGTFMVNGLNYGAKTAEAARKYAAMFYIGANGPQLGRGNSIYTDGGGTKVDANKAVNTAKGIKSSAPGSALVIDNGKVSTYTPEQLDKLGLDSGTSFIGVTKNGVWFAGTTSIPDPGTLATAVFNYYKGNVKNMGVSDGSASRQFFANGKKYAGSGRPVTVGIAW